LCCGCFLIFIFIFVFERRKDVRVCVIEKAPEMGAHTLSGAVLEPRALDELYPDWRNMGSPIKQKAGKDQFVFLTEKKSFKFPITPPQMHNEDNYIVRLGNVVKWLAEQAEAAGVEIYSGIAASSIL
jgi:electron-transferring-flavoprotein dehydrogenase